MKLSFLSSLLAVAVTSAGSTRFRYERPILTTPGLPTQTCMTVDAELFAHAAPGLADLRLFHGSAEIPYVVRTAEPVTATQTTLTALNLGLRNGQANFDAVIPGVTYSDVALDIATRNFIATVTVTGKQATGANPQTRLGSFTIFDLSGQKLGRSTVLHLPTSNFKYLHFQVAGPVKPEDISGLSVVREPNSQIAFTPVAASAKVNQQGHTSVIEFTVPAHVPVDRVFFQPGAKPAAFTRDVSVTIASIQGRPATEEDEPPQPTTFSGNILRLHRLEDGQQIDEDRFAVGANNSMFAEGTRWIISVENGDDPPLILQYVQLEAQSRSLCFESVGSGPYSLFYGDPSLTSPHYDYATLFTSVKNPAQAVAGPEQLNPAYQRPADRRPFTERHPALLWASLLLTLSLLGTVALRSASSTERPA